MKQVFLSIEPSDDEADLFKVAILTLNGKTLSGKTEVVKVLSQESYDKSDALKLLSLHAQRSFFDE